MALKRLCVEHGEREAALAVPSYGAMALKPGATSAEEETACILQSPPTGRWP